MLALTTSTRHSISRLLARTFPPSSVSLSATLLLGTGKAAEEVAAAFAYATNRHVSGSLSHIGLESTHARPVLLPVMLVIIVETSLVCYYSVVEDYDLGR